ncbi:hypothetical protein GQX74_000768 [Glossina fuscipes]|nr:hypothetical protein GQX74_000768 [Glossina fuscipes]
MLALKLRACWQNSNCVNACINIFNGQWVKVEKDSVSSYTNSGVDIMTTDVFTRDVDMPLIGNRRTLNVLFRSLHVRGGKDDSQEPVGLPRCTRVVFWRRMPPPPPLPTA